MGYVELVGRDGIVRGSGDCGRRRYGYDHCYEWIGEHDRDSYGESGRVERNTVIDEPVAFVDRGNGNTHTDRD